MHSHWSVQVVHCPGVVQVWFHSVQAPLASLAAHVFDVSLDPLGGEQPEAFWVAVQVYWDRSRPAGAIDRVAVDCPPAALVQADCSVLRTAALRVLRAAAPVITDAVRALSLQFHISRVFRLHRRCCTGKSKSFL